LSFGSSANPRGLCSGIGCSPSDIHPKQERIIRRARVPRCWIAWGLLWSHQSQAEQIGL